MDLPLLTSAKIKAEALRLGFSACGIAQAQAVDDATAISFRQWLAEGKEAGMSYMGNYLDKRLDPRLLMEGAQTIVSVALNYYPAAFQQADTYQFAWYAYGKDYHDVMKAKLAALQEFIAAQVTGIDAAATSLNSRAFCDTAPLLERYWAWRAGLGWMGKHTQLIIPHAGSCFFLGELLLNTKADTYDQPQPNRCGTCTRCLQACPTGALEALETPPSKALQANLTQAQETRFSLNSERCLSYLTIEHRETIPLAMAQKMGKKMYGCDDCLKACPWNRFSTPCHTPELHPAAAFLAMKKPDWEALTEEQYRSLFKGSAVKRAKYSGLMRNIHAASKEQ